MDTQSQTNFSICRYVRNTGKTWEYGIIEKDKNGNIHKKIGETKSLSKACEMNSLTYQNGK